jgi:hypothetical protein
MTLDPETQRAMNEVHARIEAKRRAERGSVETHSLIPGTQSIAAIYTRGLAPVLWADLGELGSRKVILLKEGDLLPILAGVEGAILADKEAATVFQRAGLLVYLKRNPIKCETDDIKRDANALTIVVATKDWLKLRIDRAATFQKLDKRTGRCVTKDPPPDIVAALFGAGMWHFKPLVATIETPTLREDGTVLNEPGYDDQTGLFFDPGDAKFPPIADRPTREDARAALDKLKDVFREFPFVQTEEELGTGRSVARSVALAGLLTTLVRRSLRTAPLFLMDAPTPASGKTLLVNVIFQIAIGREAATMTYTGDEQETRKALTALLMAGDPIALLDNVDLPLRGASLCAALTSAVFKDRVLGLSRNVELPVLTTWFATGNNVPVEGDLVRRVLISRIDPACERPEERTFERADLLAHAREHRGELIAAALTILRAYVVAGRPDQGLKPWGSFEDWSKMIRAPLVWLGEADPVSSQASLSKNDPQREAHALILHAWVKVYKHAPITCAEIARQVSGKDRNYLEVTADMAELREALESVLDRGELKPRSLGRWLQAHQDRVIDGLVFRKVGTKSNSSLWRVEAI